MSKNQKYAVLITAILTLILGFVFNIVLVELEGVYKYAPYIMIGVGSGIAGGIGGELLSKRAQKKNPELAESILIEQNDERNIQIKNKAKAKVLDTIVFLLVPFYIGIAFSSTNLLPIFVLIALNILAIFYFVFLISKYNREM